MTIRVEQGKGRKDRYTLLSVHLLEELRSEQPELPVIVMSGTNTPENRDRSWRLGVTAFLTKPFALSQLHALLDNLGPAFEPGVGNATPATTLAGR